MKKKIYLETKSGISGDMFVAALLDLGVDQQQFLEELAGLKLDGYRIAITRVNKNGVRACDFDVILDVDNHDHHMEYLHGQDENVQSGEYDESGKHDESDKYRHTHAQRSFRDIKGIIEESDLRDRVKELAVRIFGILAKAEATAHGVSEEEVHFHEVGAVDSIVDIVSAALCVDLLEVEEVIVPALYDGRGTVRCQHGILQVPVPAVRNIVDVHDIRLEILPAEGELVTPTGAAIVAALRTDTHLPDRLHITRSGVGAGKRQYETEGLVRAHLLA